MQHKLVNLAYEIDLQVGETFTIPEAILKSLEAGRWRITITPIDDQASPATRSHDAFLNGYAPEDEGLYDDYPTR
ncbi:MAG: hypothetical protein B0A82_27190 [Alkalinema sp. CACIAM 70d]|nr:MAG: hypothetical protein B0A82_27190 [Alkalinema sp. CACIAM 70d]